VLGPEWVSFLDPKRGIVWSNGFSSQRPAKKSARALFVSLESARALLEGKLEKSATLLQPFLAVITSTKLGAQLRWTNAASKLRNSFFSLKQEQHFLKASSAMDFDAFWYLLLECNLVLLNQCELDSNSSASCIQTVSVTLSNSVIFIRVWAYIWSHQVITETKKTWNSK